MTHAVFFVDDGCEYVGDWRRGEVDYVVREGGCGEGEQCVRVGERHWGSVEFMGEEEWEVWRAGNL